jgi:sporulation-control protein
MRNLLARVGIGAATVDTVLPTTTLTQGESVDARVEMHGGSTEQEIDAIYLALKTQYEADVGSYEIEEDTATKRTTLREERVTEPFTLGPDEERTVEVTVEVPRETPVTLGETQVWLDTGLDVSRALDPDDRDHVDVVPGPHLDALIDALDELGFALHSVSCRSAEDGFFPTPEQEFGFRPRDGQYAEALDELELVATPADHGLDVVLGVDRREGLLSTVTDGDEGREEFTVTHTDVDRLADEVRTLVDRHA